MRLILFILFITPALAQGLFNNRVHIGAVAGVPMTKQLSYGHNDSPPFLVGPSVEVRIHGGFALEVDAIYRRISTNGAYSFLSGTNLLNGEQGTTVHQYSYAEKRNSWELPVLAKYTFRRSLFGLNPFLATGYAFRTTRDSTKSSDTTADTSSNFESHSWSRFGVGAVVAAGASFRAGPFKISPQFRYTRWGEHQSTRRTSDQVDFMVGFHF